MYDKISEWLSLHPLFSGGFISFLLAVLRLFRERRSFPAALFEGAICALLTVGLFSGVQYMFPNMQTDTCVAFGAMIGYLGTDYVKLVLQSLIPARRSEAQKAVDKSETETDNTSDS
jgi:lambda family phage holin